MAAVNGEALRVIREKDGWNLKELAEHVGVSPQYLGDIERQRAGYNLKRNPGLIKRLAEALNVPQSMIERRSEPEAVSS